MPPVFQPLPGATIADDQIETHIPRNTDPSDRKMIKEVMLMLPPRLRQYIVWLHVPEKIVRERPAVEKLPNHNLLITLDMRDDNKQDSSKDPVGGCCVLYFDGQVQPHSNLTYEPFLDSFLTIGTHDWQWTACSPTGQEGLTCARTSSSPPTSKG
jgi:hypothetical protein